MGSTNGTVIQLGKPRQPSKEQIELQEAIPERDRAIAEFRGYIRKHQAEIERGLENGSLSLTDLFYDFYNTNIDNPKYRENDPEVQQLIREYSKQREKIEEDLRKETQRGRGLSIGYDLGNYWLYVNTNGGLRDRNAIGRFYLNLRPENICSFFYKAAERFRDSGLHVQMKIPRMVDANIFNRLDKMVIYFSTEEEQGVLQVIENLYRSHRNAFDETGIPRFTAEIRNQQGEKMAGIGFGEEPALRGKSFGEIRAYILAQIYNEAKQSGLSILDPRFDFEAAFRRACLSYQVDPRNPAFNLRTGLEKFPELRRRMIRK